MKRTSQLAAAMLALMAPAAAISAGRPTTEEVSFASADGTARYAGTLTLPEDEGTENHGPYPAVVLLSVAGPNDRDQTVGNNKGFAELAEALATRGVASLRFDDRGVGGSTGTYFEASWTDLTNDAMVAARHIGQHSMIDGTSISFAGMSQGAALAARACKMSSACRFAAMLSPPGLPGEMALREQFETMIATSGLPDEVASGFRQLMERYFAIHNSASETRREDMIAFLNGQGRSLIPPYAFLPQESEALADVLLGRWYQDNLNFDPVETYQGMDKPILIVGGDLDPIANPEQHWATIRRTFAAKATFLRLSYGNHLLQSAQTGSPLEYQKIGHGMAPATLAMISEWMAINSAGTKGESDQP